MNDRSVLKVPFLFVSPLVFFSDSPSVSGQDQRGEDGLGMLLRGFSAEIDGIYVQVWERKNKTQPRLINQQ